jgi:enoyl-CoA hydratase/carnithine racemase
VIITGAGGKAFVAGADISEFTGLNQQIRLFKRIYFTSLRRKFNKTEKKPDRLLSIAFCTNERF